MTAAPRLLTAVLLALLLVQQAAAETLTGKVVSIADGDTLTLLVDREQIKVRLEGIDAPEKSQPYGDKAKQELSRLAFGKSRSRPRARTSMAGRWGECVQPCSMRTSPKHRRGPASRREDLMTSPATEHCTSGRSR